MVPLPDLVPTLLTPEPTRVRTDVWLARCDSLLDALRDGAREGSGVIVTENADGSRVATASDGLRVTESPDGNIHCNR